MEGLGRGMEGKARQKRARRTGQEERRKDGLCNSQQVKVTNIGESMKSVKSVEQGCAGHMKMMWPGSKYSIIKV